MRRPGLVPSPVAFLSAALSFGLLIGTAVLAQSAMPTLGELLRSNPRLAMLGFCGILLTPAIVVTLVHHVGGRTLDGMEAGTRRRGILPNVQSVWAGASAWLIIGGASILARLAMLVAVPPKLDPEGLVSTLTDEVHAIASSPNLATLYPVFWLLIAAQLFELERRTRRVDKKDA